MTISELAKASCLKDKTVKRNVMKIKGVYRDNEGNIIIPDGSRYPYDLHRYKLTTKSQKRLALLDATNRSRYVDHESLSLSKEAFASMINDLLTAGYLVRNGQKNTYGANEFDTTIKYDELMTCNRREKVQIMENVVSMAKAVASVAVPVISSLL